MPSSADKTNPNEPESIEIKPSVDPIDEANPTASQNQFE
jgi:hypothetical protein